MDNNHDAFLKTYHATRIHTEKKKALKVYMLSLSSDELDTFIFNNLDSLEQRIKASDEKNKLSELDKKQLILKLDDLSLIVTTKAKYQKTA